MKTKTALVIILLSITAALVASFALYEALPDRLPTHWDLQGRVNGWSDKSFGAFFGPGIMLLMLFLLVAGEWISPIQFKIAPFRDTFNYLVVISTFLGGFLHSMILLAATHSDFDAGRWIVGGIFVFLAAMGNLLGKTRRNFWIGIRTPWTLASDAVWIATHRLAARLLVGAGLIGAVSIALGAPTKFCFGLLIAALVVPTIYSFWLSKRLERTQPSSD
jgi:uncharacterized membrane protein